MFYLAKSLMGVLFMVVSLLFVAGCSDLKLTLISNSSPVIVVKSFPNEGVAPFTVFFDASNSYDIDGDSFSISWHFVEEQLVESGLAVSHTFFDDSDYNNDGFNEGYQVVVVAEDVFGNRSFANFVILVYNPAPVVNFIVNRNSSLTLTPITFDASASYDPASIIVKPRGKIIEYKWDFGDGAVTYGVVVQHTYLKKGDYQVVLSLTDDDYMINQARAIVSVDNRNPVARINYWLKPQGDFTSQDIIIVSRPFVFDASSSFDEDGSIVKYVWRFSDGLVFEGKQIERTFDKGGVCEVLLEVIDDDGGRGWETISIRI